MSGDPRKIHITRKGEQFGPYPEETARQFLSDGQLKATDLAWHDGADGWKPLPEVLGIAAAPDAPPPPPAPGNAPPSEPAAPAGPPPDTVVHISRNGERHGPYKYETAKKYLAEGALKPTDSSWHEGLDGWKPLGELMGGTASAGAAAPPPPATGKNCPQCSAALEPNAIFCIQCGFNLQTGQGTQSIPAAAPGMGMPVAGQPAGPATYAPHEEEDFKATHLMYIGVAMIVGVVLPVYNESLEFPNFALSGASAKFFIASLWPLAMGITLAAMAKSTRDPVRCSVALGLSLFYLMFIEFGNIPAFAFGGEFMMSISFFVGIDLFPGGPAVVFFIGIFCLVMGCHARHMRPGNLPAYILSLVGGGFLCLNWLIPSGDSEVPFFSVFKQFDGSVVGGLCGVLLMGSQIAAAVFCFITPRSKPPFEVAGKSMWSLQLFIGSFAGYFIILALYIMLKIFTMDGPPFAVKFKGFFSLLLTVIKLVPLCLGILLAAPIAGSCLLTRLMRR